MPNKQRASRRNKKKVKKKKPRSSLRKRQLEEKNDNVLVISSFPEYKLKQQRHWALQHLDLVVTDDVGNIAHNDPANFDIVLLVNDANKYAPEGECCRKESARDFKPNEDEVGEVLRALSKDIDAFDEEKSFDENSDYFIQMQTLFQIVSYYNEYPFICRANLKTDNLFRYLLTIYRFSLDLRGNVQLCDHDKFNLAKNVIHAAESLGLIDKFVEDVINADDLLMKATFQLLLSLISVRKWGLVSDYSGIVAAFIKEGLEVRDEDGSYFYSCVVLGAFWTRQMKTAKALYFYKQAWKLLSNDDERKEVIDGRIKRLLKKSYLKSQGFFSCYCGTVRYMVEYVFFGSVLNVAPELAVYTVDDYAAVVIQLLPFLTEYSREECLASFKENRRDFEVKQQKKSLKKKASFEPHSLYDLSAMQLYWGALSKIADCLIESNTEEKSSNDRVISFLQDVVFHMRWDMIKHYKFYLENSKKILDACLLPITDKRERKSINRYVSDVYTQSAGYYQKKSSKQSVLNLRIKAYLYAVTAGDRVMQSTAHLAIDQDELMVEIQELLQQIEVKSELKDSSDQLFVEQAAALRRYIKLVIDEKKAECCLQQLNKFELVKQEPEVALDEAQVLPTEEIVESDGCEQDVSRSEDDSASDSYERKGESTVPNTPEINESRSESDLSQSSEEDGFQVVAQHSGSLQSQFAGGVSSVGVWQERSTKEQGEVSEPLSEAESPITPEQSPVFCSKSEEELYESSPVIWSVFNSAMR